MSRRNLSRDTNGATAFEYGMIAALIAVVIISFVTAAGPSIKNGFNSIAQKLQPQSQTRP